MLKVFRKLETDLKEVLYNEINRFFNKQIKCREQKVLACRIAGLTLEEIGNQIGVTRERVRQIEKNARRKYQQKYCHLLKTFSQFGNFINKLTLKKIYKGYTDAFIYLNCNNYDKTLNLYVFQNINGFKLRFLKYLNQLDINYLQEDDFDSIVMDYQNTYLKPDNLSRDKELLLHIMKSSLIEVGTYYFKSKPSQLLKYEIILKNHFLDYKGLNNENVDVFREVYFEIFEEESIFDRSNRAIIARISDSANVILSDRGTYRYVENNELYISNEDLKLIYDYIIQKEKVFTTYLYNKFRDRLPKVKNKHELHGLLARQFPNLYFTKDVVGTTINPRIDIDSIINEYAYNKGGAFSLETLKYEVPELDGSLISFHIGNTPKIISMFHQRYIHVENLYIDQTELKNLKLEVTKRLSDGDTIGTKIFYQLMIFYAPTIVEQNNVTNTHFSYSIFRYFFEEEFNFDYPLIRLINDESTRDSYRDILEKLVEKDIFRVSDIQKEFQKNSLTLYSVKRVLDRIYEYGFMRLNKDVVAKSKRILTGNAQQVYIGVEELLLYYLDVAGEIDLDNFDFTLLPKVNLEWNKHILAHFITNLSSTITVETLGNQYTQLKYILKKGNR